MHATAPPITISLPPMVLFPGIGIRSLTHPSIYCSLYTAKLQGTEIAAKVKTLYIHYVQ